MGQEDRKFKASLNYCARPYAKTKQLPMGEKEEGRNGGEENGRLCADGVI